MRGIILAGGTGSRLFPLTLVTNKHLLPVGSKPMIYHPVERLAEAGITEILIVTGVEHIGSIVGLLKSGREFGCQFTYRVQDEAGGIAQALSLAEHFAGDERVCVILGDNIFTDKLKPHVDKYYQKSDGAFILLKEVSDPKRFGVAELDGDKIVSIVEKPTEPKSNLCVTGIYMYDSQVWNIIRTLKPSGRGELEITDVNNAYIRTGNLGFGRLEGSWTDAGTFKSLQRANDMIFKMEK